MKALPFAIKFIEGTFSDGGYWTGKSYTDDGAMYGILEHDREKAKVYTSKSRAENAAEKLFKKISNVHMWEIEETK